MIFIYIFLVIMPLIIASPINRQNFFTKGTEECISNDAENYERKKRDVMQKDYYYRWKFPIRFYIEYDDFDYFDYFYIFEHNLLEALEIIQNNTCVTFNRSWIPIQNEQGLNFKLNIFCSSKVGLINPNKPQDINLSLKCYGYKAHILHEIGHALGLLHEQSRSDRDKYVNIDLGNVEEANHRNFRKFNYTSNKNYSTSYDYASVMHYPQYAFAIKSKEVVITSKLDNAYNKMMGQRIKMTFNDFKIINLYHCNTCHWVDKDGKRNKTNYKNAQCKNNGYPHYNECNKCICPVGYTGDLCQKIVSGSKECGKTTFYAQKYQQKLFFNGTMICYIFILAKDEKNKIKIKILFSKTSSRSICTEDISNQIKYRKDKGNTGLLLCGHNENISLKSGSNSVLIIYRGSSQDSRLILTYQQFSRRKKS